MPRRVSSPPSTINLYGPTPYDSVASKMTRRAQPDSVHRVGNATINPDYYNTPQGQAELADLQSSIATRQLMELQSSAAQQSQVTQIGGHILTPGERADRQELADATLSTAAALAPLAASGMADAGDVRKAIGQTVTDTLGDRRNVRAATRDMETIVRLRDNGTHSERQTAGALQSMKQKYGNLLNRVPGYAEVAGIEQVLERQKLEAREKYAAEKDIPIHLTRFNNETFEPEFDYKGAAIEGYKSQQQDAATAREDKVKRREMEGREAKANAINNQMKILSQSFVANRKNGVQPNANDLKLYDSLAIELMSELSSQQKAADVPAAEPSISDAIKGTAPTPVSESVSMPKFDSRQEVTAAVKSGQVQVGKPFLVEGARYVLGSNGEFRRVN